MFYTMEHKGHYIQGSILNNIENIQVHFNHEIIPVKSVRAGQLLITKLIKNNSKKDLTSSET